METGGGRGLHAGGARTRASVGHVLQAEARAQGARRRARHAALRRSPVRTDALAARLAPERRPQIVARKPSEYRAQPATPPKQIDIAEEYQLQYWSRALRVSRNDLVEAVKSVGTSARAVSRALGKG